MRFLIYICEFCDKTKYPDRYVQRTNVCPACGKNEKKAILIDEDEILEKIK